MRISDWSSDVCSSDLPPINFCAPFNAHMRLLCYKSSWHGWLACRKLQLRILPLRRSRVRQEYRHADTRPYPPRSEEHTSELQSLMRISYAVFCLKKKKKTYEYNTILHDIKQQEIDR